jgi:hypothetical protein
MKGQRVPILGCSFSGGVHLRMLLDVTHELMLPMKADQAANGQAEQDQKRYITESESRRTQFMMRTTGTLHMYDLSFPRQGEIKQVFSRTEGRVTCSLAYSHVCATSMFYL